MGATQRVRVTVNGNTYLVEVGDLSASPVTVIVDGRQYKVDLEMDAVAVEIGGAETDAGQLEAAVAHSGSDVRTVTAPMPGNIVGILVQAGDQVSLGQKLCSLEAMKMQNAIRSPRSAVIAAVHVADGEAVRHGDLLFTFK
ncbi:MAG: biotin/lipoyl-containing protein [Anaerolineae bacterium]